jgi:TonB-dependent receptor
MQTKSTISFIFLYLLFGLSTVLAQTGTIRGKVTDGTTGDVLLGATVRLMQAEQVKGGAYSDIEGAFTAKVPAGTYQVLTSYISYLTDTAEVTVEAGQVATLSVLLYEESNVREDLAVNITAKRSQASEVAFLAQKQNAINSIDGVTFDLVQRTGDANAAAAVQRVVGVTIEDGKYVYVRGLGDRYSKTMLNGAEIPGLDPNRNTVQMDIFPSNLLDQIIVYKNFTPNLPGSFTGGLVDVRTKDFPDRLTIRASASIGYNDQASLNEDFIADQSLSGDRLALGNEVRDMPAYIANELEGTLPRLTAITSAGLIANVGPALDSASRSFQTGFLPTQRQAGLENQYRFSIGNQHQLFGKPFGYIASLSYRQSFSYYDEVERNLWRLRSASSTILDAINELEGRRGEENVLWGGLLKLSYKPSPNHKFSVNYMRNQNGTSYGESISGTLNNESGYSGPFFTSNTGYLERSISVLQGQGDHAFGAKLRADWIVSASRATQYEPDIRFFAYEFTVNDQGDSTFGIINNNGYERPLRFYRDLREDNLDVRLNLSYDIPGIATQEKGAIRVGGSYTTKERSFNETRFEIFDVGADDQPFRGDVDAYVADSNLMRVVLDEEGDLVRSEFFQGLYYQDQTQPTNVFDAEQSIIAAYAMAELPLGDRLKLITGLRYEGTEMLIMPEDTTLLGEFARNDSTATPGELVLDDLLPAVNFVYRVSPDMSIRAGYTRTLARPTIVEFSPFQRLPYIGSAVYEGNPGLERTLIDNVDLRWEWFFSLSELVSVSAFYKNFQNPIEVALDSNANTNNIRFAYVNRESAFTAGLEIELRKHFGFIAPGLEKLQFSGNASFNYSRSQLTDFEILAIRAVDPDRDAQRPLFGQSPYVFNGELAYIDKEDLGLQVSLSYNVFGPRISFVGIAGAPDVYEQPRPAMNFSISKDIGKYLALRIRLRNLLNPEYRFIQDLRGDEYVFTNTRMGRTYSVALSFKLN